MYQPKTTEDYLELVDQAIFEVQDLVRCAEEEDDGIVEFAAQLPVYRELAEALQTLRAEVAAGTHKFGDKQDLPFMHLVRQWRSRIPFHVLLGALNTAHKEGF
ncbi:MAG: hypothetical protein A2V58_00630 [Candidatus Muproteobacteria bacterium RBG_19FT_COMBO_61_10]|jgi:hypothetical protein|uniref:Uncharacterized protein n=1 Tax=Candidatus Muproteobacteria bacterium RBG_19FT_COMBO_61_10 TaxID=1817761 RepID=A0A1F6UNQ1_9PROT|nr:MAG: hypothetical protein A2V58_00630 [Candidatus Muproteobacteria bacterium RBG_19FT_COMBO_61_10]